MKSFLHFLSEARVSQASMQAKKLGLVGSGHGEWIDRSGKIVARTVQGKLEFIDRRQAAKPEEQAPKQQKASVMPSPKTQAKPVALPKQKKAPQEKQRAKPEETLTIVFGRFNPPTIGHEKLFDTAKRISVGGEIKIYPSRIQDPKKNPLEPDTKIHYMRKIFPEFGEAIINDPKMETIFDVLITAEEDGYSAVNIVVGSNRQAEFDNLAQKYNGEVYNFETINVVSGGVSDSDVELDTIEGMSASKMRKAVLNNDFETFRKGIPKTLDDGDTRALFDAVRQGMGVKKQKTQKENYNLWEIAPKYDMKNLRENYISGNIFNIGDKVQNLNTGIVGDVIRRGTNHLIYVTKEGYMFKSWIKDLMEYTEVKMDSPMRDKIHPNTLVGTLGAFRHYASLTPGAIGTGKENLQPGAKPYGVNLINKYRKNKEKNYSNV